MGRMSFCLLSSSIYNSVSPFHISTATNMANQKAVVHIPRSLLPRFSWSHVAAKGASSQLRPKVRSNHNRPASLSLYRLEQTRPLHTTLTRNSNTICQQPANSGRKQSNAVAVDGPPIRHDGVYVAIFKSAKRAFSTSRPHQKDHHFDTLKFVQRLKSEGFSEEQAVAMMRVLNDVIEESIQNLTRTMVLKEGAYQQIKGRCNKNGANSIVPQMPKEVPTHKKWILPNCAPSS